MLGAFNFWTTQIHTLPLSSHVKRGQPLSFSYFYLSLSLSHSHLSFSHPLSPSLPLLSLNLEYWRLKKKKNKEEEEVQGQEKTPISWRFEGLRVKGEHLVEMKHTLSLEALALELGVLEFPRTQGKGIHAFLPFEIYS